MEDNDIITIIRDAPDTLPQYKLNRLVIELLSEYSFEDLPEDIKKKVKYTRILLDTSIH